MREFSEQEIVRRQKVEDIKALCNPYPEKYDVNYSLKDALKLEDGTTDVSVAGRIVFMRKMGKLSFLKIRDIEADLQVSIKIDLPAPVSPDKILNPAPNSTDNSWIKAKFFIFKTTSIITHLLNL